MSNPITVTVTGGAGQIGYALLFRIASGGLFGPNQEVKIRILEIPPGMKAAEGVIMEIDDCAFPLLAGIDASDDILHVNIDDSSLERIGRWPWPRRRLAQLVDTLNECGARSVTLERNNIASYFFTETLLPSWRSWISLWASEGAVSGAVHRAHFRSPLSGRKLAASGWPAA